MRLEAVPFRFGTVPADRTGKGPSPKPLHEGFLLFPLDLLSGATVLTSALYIHSYIREYFIRQEIFPYLRNLLPKFLPFLQKGEGIFVLTAAFLTGQGLCLLLRLSRRGKGAKAERLPFTLWTGGRLLLTAAGLLLLLLGFFFLPLLWILYSIGRYLYFRLFRGMLKLSRPERFERPRQILFMGLMMVLALLWAAFLVWPTFHLENGAALAGVTVFSDLAPHTALTRSFGVGDNIPAQYPHFSGAGMRYHFFFYFLTGLLNLLGLPLDWALNLPSMLGSLAFMQALGYAAYRLSGRRAAWPLSFLLFAFRSSFSGYYLLFEKMRDGLSFSEALRALHGAAHYAGPLLHDDWGLYNLNVYANQRHLVWGLALVLYLLFCFYRLLPADASLKYFFRKASWTRGSGSISLLYLFFLTFPLAFWHGSAAICLLLIAGFFALFAQEKLTFFFAGLSTVTGAFAFGRFLADGSGGGLLPDSIWHWGYTLEDPGFVQVLKFLITLFGPAFFLMLLIPFAEKERKRKIAAAGLFLPSLFALTVSLTPDVTVNHKFFMMSGLFFLPFIAAFLLRIFYGKKLIFLRRAAVIILLLFLTFTGLTDFWAYKNQSRIYVRAETDSAFTDWIYEHTDPGEISLTPPWSYHAYFLCGRQSFYGHAYYAASAGYATEERLEDIRAFLEAPPGSDKQLKDFVKNYGLRYLMIDDGWRAREDYFINEEGLAAVFPEIARFPEADNLRIYDLQPEKS